VKFGILALFSLGLTSCDLSQPLLPKLAPVTPSVESSESQPTLIPTFENYFTQVVSTDASVLNLATPSDIPTALVLTATPIQNSSSPEGFVRFYYSNINMRNYEFTWSLLTQNFISQANPPSQGGYQGYVKWWNTVDSVDVTEVDIIIQNKDSATIRISATYHYHNGATTQSQQRFYLIYDTSRSTWLFD
jgi:hypothetical protein